MSTRGCPNEPYIIKDLLADVLGDLRCNSIPLDQVLEVYVELFFEAQFMKFLADKCAYLPFIDAELNLGW